MLAEEHPLAQWLVGGVDEISDYHLNIETLNGTFKADPCDNGELYASVSKGSLAGEGAAMFRVGGTALPNATASPSATAAPNSSASPNACASPNGAASPNAAATDGPGASNTGRFAAIAQVDLFHSTDPTYVQERLQAFIGEDMPDLVLIGENGDPAFNKYYDILNAQPAALARFKHMSGESPTASAFATWLATHVIHTGASLPAHMIKKGGSKTMDFTNVVIYNTYQGKQQGMIRVKLAQ
jgi:hypothetical protein